MICRSFDLRLRLYVPGGSSSLRCVSLPTCNYVYIFRGCSTTTADQSRACLIPFPSFFTERSINRMPIPIVLGCIVRFARVGIDKNRFIGCFPCLTDQRRDIFWRCAIDPDSCHEWIRLDQSDTIFESLSLIDMRFIATTKAYPRLDALKLAYELD